MADDTIYRYKHKTIRRFATAQFEFKNFQIDIVGDEANDEFREVIDRLPEREKVNIVSINVEAQAAAERSFAESAVATGAGGAVRGPMGAGDIKTALDSGLAAKQNPNGTDLAAAQAPAKPVGFGGLNLLNPNGK